MSIMDSFSTKLKFIREKAGLTQIEMAKMLNVSRGSIGYYENAERVPDIEFLDRLISEFDVSYQFLMGYSDNMRPENIDVGIRTGLSDEAIELLDERIFDLDVFNLMIESPHFTDFINTLNDYAREEEKSLCKGQYERFLLTQFIMEIIEDVCMGLRIKERRQKYGIQTDEELREILETKSNHIIKDFESHRELVMKEFQQVNINSVSYQARVKLHGKPENQEKEGVPNGKHSED